ncbi:hypothetical protein ACWOB3_03840 [Enterococcus songbeiensis]
MTELLINTIVKEGEPGTSQIEFLSRLGEENLPIAGVEVRREMFSADAAKRKEEMETVRSLKKKYDWKMMYSVPESLFLSGGINPELDIWLEELASFEGISMKVNTGEFCTLSKEAAQQFTQKMGDSGIQLRIENDQTPENGKLANVKRVLETIKAEKLPIDYTFDLGNWQIMKENPEKAWAEVSQYVDVIHLKNMDAQGKAVLLDKKLANWPLVVKNQKIVIFEYPMNFTEIPQEISRVQAVIV